MGPVSFRKSKGWSQAQLAAALGLDPASKGYISRLESGAQLWPLRLALKLQQISDGQVSARSLRPDAAEFLPEPQSATEARA